MNSQESFKKNTAFTLIELIVVIIIIGILASVAVPAYNSYVQKTKEKNNTQILSSLRQMLESYYMENGSYPAYTSHDSIRQIMDNASRPTDHLTLFVEFFSKSIPINAFCTTMDELKDDTMQDIYSGTVYDNGIKQPYDMEMVDDAYISTDVLGIIPVVESGKVIDYQVQNNADYVLYGSNRQC